MRALFISLIFLFSQNVQAQIDSQFIIEAKYNHFNGNVGIYDGDKTMYHQSFGLVNPDQAINLETRFDIGSISKQFTAAAILHLQNEGKLNVDDPINQHLGAYANKKWKKVTIHQLLTHTSGIPSLFQTEQGLELVFASEDAITLDQLIGYFSEGDLLFKSGEEFSYSNSGYILLAAIVEETSELDFFTFMESAIFQKYGLDATSFRITENTAKPQYGYLPEQQKSAPVYDKSWLIGAGGVYSTLSDLSKWVQLITSDDFLTQELRTLFLSPKTNAGGGLKYGYGWQFTSDGIIEHDGGNAGFISFLSFDPESKQHHVLLTNRSFESIYDLGKSSDKIRTLSNKIWKWRKGEAIEIHPHPMKENTSADELMRISTSDLSFYHDENGMLTVSSPNIPLLRTVVRTPIEATSNENDILIEIARHLENHSFWKFAKYCDGEMKFVAYSGLFRFGFSMMKKQVGTMERLVPYSMEGNRGDLRMIGDEASLDLVVYFNDEGKVMGVFDTGTFELESPTEMKIYRITEQSFWIDGFPYGEQSAYLIWDGSRWALQQFGRTIQL